MKKEPRILLIEDNAGDAELTTEALKNQVPHSEISIIKNGEDALRFLKREGSYVNEKPPHLILLDINLPKIDGREVLQFIKKDGELKCIPVIIFSTSSLQEDISFAYVHYANCYIVISSNLTDFNDSINSICKFWINCVTYPTKD